MRAHGPMTWSHIEVKDLVLVRLDYEALVLTSIHDLMILRLAYETLMLTLDPYSPWTCSSPTMVTSTSATI
jgi:hypothetical protein